MPKMENTFKWKSDKKEISDVKEQIEQIEQEIGNLNDNVAFKNKENVFSGVNTFTNDNFKINRLLYMGRQSGSNGDVWFLANNQNKSTIRLGWSEYNDQNRFDLNMENRSFITNLPDPTDEKHAANKKYVDTLKPYLVYVKSLNTLTFTRQVLEEGKVTKYYSNKVLLSAVDTNVQSLISVALEDIPADGQHLVVTQFVRRGGDGFIVEIYQYNSNSDIKTNLNGAKYQVAYTKRI